MALPEAGRDPDVLDPVPDMCVTLPHKLRCGKDECVLRIQVVSSFTVDKGAG